MHIRPLFKGSLAAASITPAPTDPPWGGVAGIHRGDIAGIRRGGVGIHRGGVAGIHRRGGVYPRPNPAKDIKNMWHAAWDDYRHVACLPSHVMG